MKILVAEDNPEKISRLRQFFRETPGVSEEDVSIVQTIFDAQQALKATTYELFVLDVLLPNRPGDEPTHTGAIGLLEELSTRSTLRKPRHVLGLTAFDDAIREAGPEFVSRTWAVVKFSFESDEWKGQLAASIAYILAEAEQAPQVDYQTDLCIVTALSVPEMTALGRLPWAWAPFEPLDDVTFMRRGSFTAGSQTFSVVAATASKIGMVHSALLAAKLIERMRPRFIVMAGICAGVKGKANYGDVILADPAWDWQSGKHLVGPDGQEFAIAPDPLPAPAFIRSRFEQFRGDHVLWAQVKADFPATPETELKARKGPVASGSSVLADADIVDQVKIQNRNLLGIEMEAYGVLAAATEARHPRPTGFSIKSVCDFADDEKNDTWQAYAAYTSAQAVRHFFERYMPEIRDLAGSA